MRISDWSSDVCSSDLLLALLGGARQRPASAVEDAALLGEGRAHRVAVGDGEACHVVIILAHGDLAGLQCLLELRLVAVPQAHVRLHLGQLVEGLEDRSEEHTSELQSLMRTSYAVLCLKKKNKNTTTTD